MMKILQIGTNGQVGWELLRTCAPLGDVVALDYPDVDLSEFDGLRELVRTVKPDIILNAAAYTNVDKAESEPEKARAINAIGPGVLAEEAKKINAVLVHYSTDYVFDGTKGSPYLETDTTNPLNYYGQTKLEAEQAIESSGCINFILRTSCMYSMQAGGFVTKVLQWSRTQQIMRVVDDQICSPTSARLMAEVTAALLAKVVDHSTDWLEERRGVYHCAGAGACNRYEWAKQILRLDPNPSHQVVKDLVPAKSSEFHSTVVRPLATPLDNAKLWKTFGLSLPDWLVCLQWVMEKH